MEGIISWQGRLVRCTTVTEALSGYTLGVSQPWRVTARISVLLGCIMRIRLCKSRRGVLLCLAVVKSVLDVALEEGCGPPGAQRECQGA